MIQNHMAITLLGRVPNLVCGVTFNNRNLPRWHMIEREINDDLRSSPRDANGKGMIMVDYGSNYGYFSMQLAQKFPKGTVFSLEGEAWKGMQMAF